MGPLPHDLDSFEKGDFLAPFSKEYAFLRLIFTSDGVGVGIVSGVIRALMMHMICFFFTGYLTTNYLKHTMIKLNSPKKSARGIGQESLLENNRVAPSLLENRHPQERRICYDM